MLVQFWNNQSGSTAIEYALIGSFVVVAFVGSVMALGSEVGSMFDGTGNLVGTALKQN